MNNIRHKSPEGRDFIKTELGYPMTQTHIPSFPELYGVVHSNENSNFICGLWNEEKEEWRWKQDFGSLNGLAHIAMNCKINVLLTGYIPPCIQKSFDRETIESLNLEENVDDILM